MTHLLLPQIRIQLPNIRIRIRMHAPPMDIVPMIRFIEDEKADVSEAEDVDEV